MANADFNTPNNSRIDGGKACMEALRKLEVAALGGGGAGTARDYFHSRKATFSDFIYHAGELSPRAAGFMETLVEYAFLTMEAGEPALDHWKSEASMSAAELAADHQRFANGGDEDKVPTVSNLVDELGSGLVCLSDFIEIAGELAMNDGNNGKIASLLDAAMAKTGRALEIAQQLEKA